MRGGAPSRSATCRVRAGEPPAAPPAHASPSWLGPPAQAHFWGSTETNTNVVYASPSAPVCGRALPPGRFPDVGCPRVTGTSRSRKRCRPQGTAFWGFFFGERASSGGRGKGSASGDTSPPPPESPLGRGWGGSPRNLLAVSPFKGAIKALGKINATGTDPKSASGDTLPPENPQTSSFLLTLSLHGKATNGKT